VAFDTDDGTAMAAPPEVDYVPTSGTLTFAVGQSSQLITVLVNRDMDEEPNESFSVNLTPISGPLGTVTPSAAGLIQNDDGPPTILITDATVVGGASGVGDAVFTVTLSVPLQIPVTVSFATQDNTAIANQDYLAVSGILTFAPGGPLAQTITVQVLGSAAPQEDETFLVNLSSPAPPPEQGGPIIGDAQALGTIIRQGLTIGGASVVEGNSGSSNALFTVNLSQAQTQVVTVVFGTEDDTATVANADYQSTSGTLTFAANETSKVITVPIVGDTTVEPNESFIVNM
jgi:chitinase